MGWAVELNLGNERVVVEKDGQRKDEKLRANEPAPQLQNGQLQNGLGRGLSRDPPQQLPGRRNEQGNNAPKGE